MTATATCPPRTSAFHRTPFSRATAPATTRPHHGPEQHQEAGVKPDPVRSQGRRAENAEWWASAAVDVASCGHADLLIAVMNFTEMEAKVGWVSPGGAIESRRWVVI